MKDQNKEVGKHKSYYDAQKNLNQTSKVQMRNQLRGVNQKTKAIEELNDANVNVQPSELIILKRVNDGYSKGSLDNLIIPENKSYFRLNYDQNGIWFAFIINGCKTTIQDDSLIFRESGKILTIKSDLLKMVIKKNLMNRIHQMQKKTIISFL